MLAVQNIADQVYDRLLDDIVRGGLPPGTLMREPELAARLGVSRTPVREAIGRLAGNGLVRLQRNRRAAVRRLEGEEIRHVYQVREALESLAAHLAAGKLTGDDVRQLRSLQSAVGSGLSAPDASGPRQLEAHHRFDRELHRITAERSGNPVLAAEIRKYHDLVQLVRNQVGYGGGALDTAYREHTAILDALAAGDPDKARDLMAAHVRGAAEAAMRRFAAGNGKADATDKGGR